MSDAKLFLSVSLLIKILKSDQYLNSHMVPFPLINLDVGALNVLRE